MNRGIGGWTEALEDGKSIGGWTEVLEDGQRHWRIKRGIGDFEEWK